MALNLIRNSRVFFTTNVTATGAVAATGFTNTNTYEIQVQDGFSFSQNSAQETVTLNEAGISPIRGQRSFNTSLEPADWSFSTYIRPRFEEGSGTVTLGTIDADDYIAAEESVLWNAMASTALITAATGTGWVSSPGAKAGNAITGTTTYTTITGTGVSTATTAFTGVPQKSSSGSGVGATFNITRTASTTAYTGNASITGVVTGGYGYTVGDTVTISGADLGGIDITNDLTFTLGTSVSAVASTPFATVGFGNSNKHQLQQFGLIICFDNSAYAIDNCVVDTATIDFGIDAIASIAWAGKGMSIREVTATLDATTNSIKLSGTAGTYAAKTTTAPYIANKLSTMTLTNSNGGTTYTVALTGGSLSISNNVTYLTPANLGTLNVPCTYFTGTRAITSSVTAYLKTGSGQTAPLLAALLAANSTENKFNAKVYIGGASNSNRVELLMPTTMLSIPTITTDQVISTAINLTAQGSNTGSSGSPYNIESTNELAVVYYSTANTV
jgi:hypothetical protein